MGEQIKLLCSETSPSNNGKDLKVIFIKRFKLPDGFWNDLFDSNCPEGLGKVNEKFKNGEDLSANDFRSLDESSINDEAQCSKNEPTVLQFKTPMLVKSLLNANHSPSLFSPLPQDYELQKGPTSSTPLPGKLVCAAAFRITPETTKNNAQNDYQTPERKLLGYTPYNTKAKTQKLSASLAMDPLEQMNLSWSSSLATPPGPGCPQQQSMNTILDRKCSFELSEIQLEELDTIKVESKSKPKPKGVARILFEKEMKSVRADVKISKYYSFENSKINGKEIQCQNNLTKSMSEDSGRRKPNEDAHAGVDSLNHFDMSSLSPLQEKAINELFALVDTRKSPGGIKTISNLIKNTLDIREEKSTLEKAFNEVVHEANNVRNHLAPDCINEHAEEASENYPDGNNIKTINENVKTNKDFKNLIDMDALSEFPMDFDLSQHITIPSTSNQGENVHPEYDNVNSNNDDQGLAKNLGLHLVPDGKTEPVLKNSVEGPDVDASKISLTDELLNNEVNKPEAKRSKHDNLYDMDALSEFPMDLYLSQNIKVPNPDPDNGNCNKDDRGLTNKLTSNSDAKCIVAAGQNETSTRKMETASQVLRDLSLRQLSDITFDEQSGSHGESKSQIIRSPEHAEQNVLTHDKEVNKTLTVRPLEDEQNDKLKIINCFDVGKCQNGKSLNPFVGFSTASGKKVTISEKSMQRARQLLNEVNKEEKNSENEIGGMVSEKVGVSAFNRRKVGDQIGQVNKPIENVVSVGFCTAYGKKVDVSMKSLNKARQIIQDVMQEESKGSKDVRKSAKVSGIGVSPALKKKFEVPRFMSNDGRVNEKERDKLKCPDKQRQNTGNDFKFSTASGKEVRISEKSLMEVKKSILDDFEHVPELSQDFLKDVEKIFIDLEKETCSSKGDKAQGDKSKADMNEGEGASVIRAACAKEGGYLGNAKHIPNENGESGRICRLETSLKPDNANRGFLSASEKEVAQSEESLKKALTHSELDGKQSGGAPGNNIGSQLDTPQKSVTGKSLDGNEVDKNLVKMKPKVVSTAFENIAERMGREEAVKNALSIPNISDNTATPGNKTTVVEEDRDVKAQGDTEIKAGIGVFTASDKKAEISQNSLQEDERIINESDTFNINGQAMYGVLMTNTASGNKVTVSEELIKKAKGILSDIENEDCSKEGRALSKIQKFGFSTPSRNEIMLSEESVKKARRILNEEDKGEQSQRKTANEKHIALTKATFESKPEGFTTASGNNVTISEASIRKAKRMLDNDENEECSKSSSKIPKFGFSTASGNEITVSEGSLKKAQMILNDVDNEGHQSEATNKKHNIPCSTASAKNKPVGFTTASGKNVTVSEASMQKAKSLLSDKESVDCSKEGTTFGKIPKFGFSTASGKEISVSEESLKKARKILNEVDSEGYQSKRKEANEKHEIPYSTAAVKNPPVGFTTASGNKVTVSEALIQKAKSFVSDKENEDCSKQGRSLSKIPKFGFSTASGNEIAISEESLKKARKILNEVDNEEDGSESKAVNEKHNSPCSTASATNANIGFTTASGNNVTVSEASIQKAKRMLDDKVNEEGKSLRKVLKFGFSTASGNEIAVSEESLRKAQMILNDVDNEGHQSEATNKKHNIPCSTASAKNKPVGFTTASGKNVTVSEASMQKAKSLLSDKESVDCSKEGTTFGKIPKFGFSTASGKEISVSEESLKKARKILNEVDSEGHQSKRKEANEKHEIPYSTAAVKNPPVGFTTASGNKVTVSEALIQKAKSFVSDKENEDCSKQGRSLSKIPKFGFSTASGNEIAISEESLKKARKILNEVDNEEDGSESKAVNEKHNSPCSTASATNANIGFTTASGNNVTVSEASIQKAKRMLDDKVNEEGKSLRKVLKFGFSTASGNEIAVSEESLKKARRILNEVDNEEPQLNHKMGKPGVATRKNIRNSRETENVLDNANSNDHESDVRPASTFQKDIPRSGKSLCDKINSTLKQTVENENDIGCRRTHKRLSSEIEIETENDRACKASRTDKVTETRKDGSKWMRFKRFDPLVTYKDRKRSNNPSRTIAVSPNLENTNQVTSCDQPVDVKTPINANSKSKPGSHFKTPYRATETIVKQRKESENNPSPNNANTPLNSCSKSGKKKTKSAKQENKERSVKPQPGSIYILRTNACFKSKRISFAEYVSSVNQQTSDEPERHGVSPSVMSITCENAESYRFKGSEFLSEDISAKHAGVRCTEGAVLFLGEDKCAGLPEFTKAFLSSPGVDPKLTNEEWIANHYKWIVWKLASYERSYPQSFSARTLTPDMVLSQLKYRYDREVDHCERSAIKKILERDDSSSRSMVLCVASLDVMEFDKNNESNINGQSKNVELQKIILMTDSWYSIRVQLDEYLQNLVREKKIYIGQKLYIQGAELCGSDQAVSPLEAPSNLHLRIHGNSTRPAKKFSRLGFHCKNSIFTVPIKSLSGAGGHVSSINVIVARQYPLQFMEKLPDGKCIFRNPRCEERIAKKFEDNVQRKREKIIFQVQKEIDNEETKTTRGTTGRKSNSLSTNQIQNLTDGKQIFDAINNASDPFHVQKCLSDEQRRIFDNYKDNLQKDRADIVRRKYEKAWSKLSEEETLKRNVVPVLKVKLVDCSPSKTNQTPGTALLTVWRPSEQTITTLGEGKRLKIYNLQMSKYKGNNNVQLSANRGTIYKALQSDATCQNNFEARKVFTFREISNGLRPNVEVDVVAIVISQLCQHNLTLVYMADSDLNLLRIKVWGGLESQGLQDVMKENNFIAACNLLSQPDRRSGIPSLKYCELSLVTSNPSNKMLRNSLYELRKAVSNPDSFITKAKAKLDELCHSNWSTPKAQNIALLNGTSSESAGKRRRTTETPPMQNTEVNIQGVRANGAVASSEFTPSSSTTTPRQSESLLQSRKRILHSKRRKLNLLGDPSPISPIPNALPASVRKAFQVPRRIRTQADDTEKRENEEE